MFCSLSPLEFTQDSIMFDTFQITLNQAEEGMQPTLMPNEIKLSDNEVVAIMGSGLSRTIQLRKAVKELSAEKLSIVRDLADVADWQPLTIDKVASLY